MPIAMYITPQETLTVLHMELTPAVIGPEEIAALQPPAELLSRRTLGLVLSGRAPVWLFCALTEWAHPFAWLGAYDPRLGGAVVVARHVANAPAIGAVVPVPGHAVENKAV